MSSFVPHLYIGVGETGAFFTLRETYLHEYYVSGRRYTPSRRARTPTPVGRLIDLRGLYFFGGRHYTSFRSGRSRPQQKWSTDVKWYELKSQETFLRSARRNPRAHYSLHIEAVHLSDTGRLCPGYRTLDDLVNAGRIKVQENGLVEVV